MTSDQLRIFAPCGMIGYGIPERSFHNGLAQNPHVLAADAGSTDPGPYYLGAGTAFTNRSMVKRDLTLILCAAYEREIPVIIGSAGGSGARPHLIWFLEIIDEINQQYGLHFPTAVIPSDLTASQLKHKLIEGSIRPLEHDIELTEQEIERASHIVAQMGPEPVMQALEAAQLVVCGRASDPAIFVAPALARGHAVGPSVHMGKILECGAAAAYPRHGTDGLLGTIQGEAFIVEPSSTHQICTVNSVAAHTLYERANPFTSRWPGGLLDLSRSQFLQYDDRSVQVVNSQYFASDQYTVKIEGAARTGYRTISIAGVRDPKLLANFEAYEANVRKRVADSVSPLQQSVDYNLVIHVYGRDGVMGASEPNPQITGHELGLVLDVVAPTEEVSKQVLAVTRSAALHSTYPDRTAIAGNLAFPFSPSDIAVGDTYEFNLYHLLDLEHPQEVFPIHYGDSAKELAIEMTQEAWEHV